MILDTLERIAQLTEISPAFAEAAAFLAQPGLADIPPGRFDLGTRGAYVIVSCLPARNADQGQLEVHRHFADVQVLVSGGESIGWRPLADCSVPAAPYDPGTDLQFFADAPQVWLSLRPGQFAVFLPGDAHLPMVGVGELRKIVVKVPVPEP